MALAFGEKSDPGSLKIAWLAGDFSIFPKIDIRHTADINGANGAYGAYTNRIYLSWEFLQANQVNTESFVGLLLEEIGHQVDSILNDSDSDSAGDEGAIFSALVQRKSFSDEVLIQLKTEDDSAVINIDGQAIAVEQQNFTGDNGNNTITGTSGDDTINAGLGSDNVNGGAGNDLLIVDYSSNTYTGSNSGINNSVSSNGTGGFNGYYQANNGSVYDTVNFSNIERFQITGTAANDQIRTGDGNDTIIGGAGNDVINAGNGINVIDGGDGIDTLVDTNFSTAANGLSINDVQNSIILSDGTSVSNIELFTNLTTGSGYDVINYTQRNSNTINTGDGDDTINAGLGSDNVNGGTGNDLLIVDYSSNTYTGSNSGINNSVSSNGTGGFNGYYQANNGSVYDTVNFSNIERFQITGTAANDQIRTGDGNDTIIGGAGNDTIDGLGGNDTITGGAGNDVITGGTGINIIDGGEGIDTLVDGNFSSVTSALSIDDTNTSKTITLADGTSVTNIELFTNLTTGSGNDVINYTQRNNNTINTGDGDDTINAGLGNDNVNGGAGNDLLIVDYSSNTYTGSSSGIGSSAFSNGTGGFNGSYQVNNGSVYDTVNFSNIERFQITGTAANDQIRTGDDNDTIISGTGNDTIDAGGGNDRLIGVAQNAVNPGLGEIDTLQGGAGGDIYIIGNAATTFYDDGNTTTAGTADYARIVGFNASEDIIQLTGPKTNYILGTSPINGVTGTAIYINKPNSEPDELIAIIEGVTGLNLNSNVFIEAQNESGLFSFSQATFSTPESNNATITITREQGTVNAASVTLALTNGTATAPGDYDNSSITVNFADGETSKTITIPIVNDNIYESNETVNLTLINPTNGAALGTQKTATLTIVDNDALPGAIAFSAANYSVNEDGTPITVVTLTRTGGSDGAVSVILTPTNGTATASSDFISNPITVNFANGETSKTVTIPVINDTINESNETINLTLTNVTGGATIGAQNTAVLTIIDNDPLPGTLAFSNANYTVNEDGTPITIVTVTRTGGSDGAVSAIVNLTNGSAIAPNDYSNTPINVNFANGETSKTVTIPITNDALLEGNETINLSLTNPTGGAILGTQQNATLVIIDNDVQLAFSNSTFSVNEDGIPINQVTVVRSGLTSSGVSATIELSNGTATTPSDYTDTPITVTFAAGETSKIVAIPIINDSVLEATETLSLTLTNPTGGATLGTQKTAILNIVDNDVVPGVIQFSNANYSINENGTPVTAITLTRTGGSDGAVSVRVDLSNGSAIAGSDYNNSSITVNFADGETSKTVTIPIIDDSILESNETINLSLSNPINGVVIGTQNSAIVNVIDNDFKPILTVNIAAEEATEGNTIQGTVTRNSDTTEPLTVTLANSDNTQITVPTTVTIAAGASSVNFNISAVDDTLIELPKNYSIIASAQGFISGSDNVAIIDNDEVTLNVTFDTTNINENGGKVIATVTRNIVTNIPLVVQLSSSDTTEATVPTTVTIAANQASATFEIQGVDDSIVDGTQPVIITAKPTYTNTNLALQTGNATANLNVVDNESPTLKLTIDRDVIAETGIASATITRNTNTNTELIVTLNSSDTTEATVPNTVIIAAGQTSATFAITGVSDGINDGSQSVNITASAIGLNSDTDSLEVTDINVPDLTITQLQGIQPTYTGKQSQFTYTVANNGIINASGSWKDRVYLSTDNKLDANDTSLGEFGLGSVENPANFAPGTSYERTVTYFAPRTPGQYYLIATTDTGNTVNEGVGIGENNNTTIAPITVTPSYRAIVSTNTETSLAGNPVILRGQAISNSDNSPIAFEFVKVRVENNGIIREFDSFTDANGNFVRQFNPLPGEAGTYNINAYFPGFASEDTAAEDQFTSLGMRFEQNNQFLQQVTQKIVEGTTFNGQVKLQNLSNIDLSGLTASIIDAPSNWTVEVTPQKTSLAGNEEITVNYNITVPDDSLLYDQLQIRLATTEGVTATLPVTVNVEQILPRLVADTSSLQASMLRGGQTLVEFTVTNQGGIASGELDILFPEAPWLKLASPVEIPSLNPGESAKISVLLQPSATQELTVYNGDLVIAGAETSIRLPFNFRAVSEAKGNLNINVVDELFFFAEGSPRLENATITLVDPFSGKVISSEQDADGILYKTDLAEGYYTLRINADSHDSYEKNIYIGAGETENVQAFLSRQTVKSTWTVTPTEIQDQYTISIESVFETNVPIPTVVIEPSFIDLDQLQVVGQVMQINVTATNHGLISAHDIDLDFGDHPFYKIEALINNIDPLAAKSSITVPVRITRIADFDTLNPAGGELVLQSTPSVPCSISARIDYSYECAGEEITRDIPIPIFNVEGNCTTPGGGAIQPTGMF
nr:Calx-beta domain-containing protein [Nostoc flagelliforme]